MNTLAQTQQNFGLSQPVPADLEFLRSTVAKNSTDEEFKLFLLLSKKYGLDPWAKEIWFIKYSDKGTPSIFTSRDGYIKIAHASGKFDGMESYTIDDESGNPIKAVALVYRKDASRPFKAEIKVSEYNNKNNTNPTWQRFPSAMAMKVAEVAALKRAFSISGVVTKEELPEGDPQSVNLTPSKLSREQALKIKEVAKTNGWTVQEMKDYFNQLGFNSASDITEDKYDEILEYFATPKEEIIEVSA